MSTSIFLRFYPSRVNRSRIITNVCTSQCQALTNAQKRRTNEILGTKRKKKNIWKSSLQTTSFYLYFSCSLVHVYSYSPVARSPESHKKAFRIKTWRKRSENIFYVWRSPFVGKGTAANADNDFVIFDSVLLQMLLLFKFLWSRGDAKKSTLLCSTQHAWNVFSVKIFTTPTQGEAIFLQFIF